MANKLYTFDQSTGHITPGVRPRGPFTGDHAAFGLYLSLRNPPTLDGSGNVVEECSIEQGGSGPSGAVLVVEASRSGAEGGHDPQPLVWVGFREDPPTRMVNATQLSPTKILAAWGHGDHRQFDEDDLARLARAGGISIESDHVIFLARGNLPRALKADDFLGKMNAALMPIYTARLKVAETIWQLTSTPAAS